MAGPLIARTTRGYEAEPQRRAELEQEVLVQLWSALARFRGDASLKTYALRVTHNVCARHVSRQIRDRSEPYADLETLGEAPDAPEDQLDRARQRALLLEAVQRLAPADRQLVLLYLEGLSPAEIAGVTGLSRSNVTTRTHRIRALLRTRLGGRKDG